MKTLFSLSDWRVHRTCLVYTNGFFYLFKLKRSNNNNDTECCLWLKNCLNIVTRNNITWKLASGFCLCYCKTFPLVPDSAVCTIFFSLKSAKHYLYHLRSNNIIIQRKTTNTEKHFYPWLTLFNSKFSCT